MVVLVACGCSAEEREQPVRDVAAGFYRALVDEDGAAACALLAPATLTELESSSGRPCAEAILGEKLPSPGGESEVTLFDNAAQVRHPSETAFLSEFDDGWRIAAAGCTARESRPYDCTLSGG